MAQSTQQVVHAAAGRIPPFASDAPRLPFRSSAAYELIAPIAATVDLQMFACDVPDVPLPPCPINLNFGCDSTAIMSTVGICRVWLLNRFTRFLPISDCCVGTVSILLV